MSAQSGIQFKYLMLGERFHFNNVLLMKIEALHRFPDSLPVNAVNLENGLVTWFDDEDRVEV